MNKILAALLALVLVLGLGTTAFAYNIEENNGSATGDVMASYVPGTAGGTVIAVDIAWEGLEFTYHGESHPVWDPGELEYGGTETPAGWDTSNGSISITNYSNAFIEASFSYSKAAGFEDASVVFGYPGGYYGCFIGNAANGMGQDGKGLAQTTTVQVVPTGFIAETVSEKQTIGTVTVTIKESTSGFSSVIASLESYYNAAQAQLLVTDPDTLEHGAVYVLSEDITNAISKITAADKVNTNNSKTDLERIQAINEAITALYSAYKIKQ